MVIGNIYPWQGPVGHAERAGAVVPLRPGVLLQPVHRSAQPAGRRRLGPGAGEEPPASAGAAAPSASGRHDEPPDQDGRREKRAQRPVSGRRRAQLPSPLGRDDVVDGRFRVNVQVVRLREGRREAEGADRGQRPRGRRADEAARGERSKNECCA